MVSTPLVEKIYHHKDKLWGIYNLTEVFKEADYMEYFIRGSNYYYATELKFHLTMSLFLI